VTDEEKVAHAEMAERLEALRRNPAALREHVERVRRQTEEAMAARERAETEALMADIQARAQAQIAAFRELPCRGETARVSACSEEFASKCERRTTPSCPRSILAFDAEMAEMAERERLRMAGIPRGVLGTLMNGFQATEATQAVDAWLGTSERLLLLSGDLGTGKSVAAGYAIKRSSGRWMHASEIAKAARFEHEDRMRELQRARLLVIDDVGAEFNDASGWGKAQLTTLLLTRYEDALRTILTTNLNPAAWKQYADPRIIDRLAEGTAFKVPGTSRRRA
jgi:DNA replication protein DnaC